VLPFVWGGRGWKKEEEMKEEREREREKKFSPL
jgi:hypothetical protein